MNLQLTPKKIIVSTKMCRRSFIMNKNNHGNRKNILTTVSPIARDKIINNNNISYQTINNFFNNNNFECVNIKKLKSLKKKKYIEQKD